MKSFTSLLVSALLATGALAGTNERLAARIARRAAKGGRSTAPFQPAVELPEGFVAEAVNGSAIALSNNWSGSIIESAPSGTSFKTVTGRTTVPHLSIPAGGTANTYAGCAWVGIDGDTYQGAILQTGFDFQIDTSGNIYYDPWFEWFPVEMQDFPRISVKAGDVIEMSVTGTSATSGTATLNNLTTGQKSTVTVKSPNSNSVLKGVNAEWIVEAYTLNSGGLTILPNFGTITISQGVATTASGTTLSPANGIPVNIYQGSQSNVVTNAKISGSSVSVTYV